MQPLSDLLPFDGSALYHGPILSPTASADYFQQLLTGSAWKSDEVQMFGRRIVTARQAAWYGDPGRRYTYSGIAREALPWTPPLLELKTRVEQQVGRRFNSCLLNLYHSGREGMGWHADNEKELDPTAPIASLSLGAARKFAFKHRTRPHPPLTLVLEEGSLLEMRPPTQEHWRHALPKSTRIEGARINLTFRVIRVI